MKKSSIRSSRQIHPFLILISSVIGLFGLLYLVQQQIIFPKAAVLVPSPQPTISCNCTSWNKGNCEGSCRRETRTCVNNCSTYLSRCVPDSTCTGTAPSLPPPTSAVPIPECPINAKQCRSDSRAIQECLFRNGNWRWVDTSFCSDSLCNPSTKTCDPNYSPPGNPGSACLPVGSKKCSIFPLTGQQSVVTCQGQTSTAKWVETQQCTIPLIQCIQYPSTKTAECILPPDLLPTSCLSGDYSCAYPAGSKHVGDSCILYDDKKGICSDDPNGSTVCKCKPTADVCGEESDARCINSKPLNLCGVQLEGRCISTGEGDTTKPGLYCTCATGLGVSGSCNQKSTDGCKSQGQPCNYAGTNDGYCQADRFGGCSCIKNNISLNSSFPPLTVSATSHNNSSTMDGTKAVDGNLSTYWNAGGFAPQWIKLDLGKIGTVSKVRLLPNQTPTGVTTHIIKVSSGGNNDTQIIAHTFSGTTTNNVALEKTFSPSLTNVRYITIETTTSPSWVSWFEIQVWP